MVDFERRPQSWAVPLCIAVVLVYTLLYWVLWLRNRRGEGGNTRARIQVGSLAANILWYGIHAANIIHFLPILTIEFDAVFGHFAENSVDSSFWDPDIGAWMRNSLTRDQRVYLVAATLLSGAISMARPWRSSLATLAHCILLYLFLCCEASLLNTLGMLSTFAFLPVMAFGDPDTAVALTEWYALFSTMTSGCAKWYVGWPYPSSLGCFLQCPALVKSWIQPYFGAIVPPRSAMDVFMGVSVLLVEVALAYVMAVCSPWRPTPAPRRGVRYWGFVGSCCVLVATFVIIIATLQVPGTFFLTYMSPIGARLAHVLAPASPPAAKKGKKDQ